MDARKEIMEKIVETQVELGSVDLVEETDGKRHWCADVHMPYQGFIHRNDIETQFRICFASEGIKVVSELMNFRARAITPAAPAKVLDFTSFRAAKMSKAA